MPATLLFFDLDGTVMVNPFEQVVFPTVLKAIAEPTGSSEKEIFAEILAEHDRRLAHPLEDRPRTMDWDDIFQAVAGRYNVSLEFSTEKLVCDHAAPPYTAVLDDACTVLEQLKNRQRKLITASMGLAKYQIPVLKGLGLYDLFDDFLMPDTTGFLKSDREFYGDYLNQPVLRIHVGDRYDHDCYFPKLFGGKAIMRIPSPDLAHYSPFERPKHLQPVLEKNSGRLSPMPYLPDAVVTNLSELPDVIAQIENS